MTSKHSGNEAAGSAEPQPGDAQALQADIERTRAQLGETVQALVAKADVKAIAKKKAATASGQLKERAQAATTQAVRQARQLRSRLASTSGTAAASEYRAQAAAATAAATLVLVAGWLVSRKRKS